MATRYTGKVTEFKVQRGFGYIEKEGEETSDAPKRVFVQWKEIKTDDRWPALSAGMEVEYSIEQGDKGKKAVNVTLPGGGKITVNRDANIEILPGIFKGTVKFYHLRRGFGYIEFENDKVPDGVDLGKDKRLNVQRSEIISDDDPPALKPGMKVQFTIFKGEKGYGAREVKMANGSKISYPVSSRESEMNQQNGNRRGMNNRGGNRGGGRNWNASTGGNMGSPGWGGRNAPGNQGWVSSWKRGREWGSQDFQAPKRPRYQQKRTFNRNRTPIQFDENSQVEVGLFIKKWLVGGLVGKRGSIIRGMCQESGCKMQFGDDNIHFENDEFRVLALSGLKDQVSKACILVANKIGEAAQSLDRKLVFLVPEEYCGMLIGKKGATIKKIQGLKQAEKVRCAVSNEPLQLPGANRVNMCTIYGGRTNVERAIKEVTEHLGFISQRIQADSQDMQPQMEMQQHYMSSPYKERAVSRQQNAYRVPYGRGRDRAW